MSDKVFQIDATKFFSSLGSLGKKRELSKRNHGALPPHDGRKTAHHYSLKDCGLLITSLASRVTNLGPVDVKSYKVSIRPSINPHSDILVLFETIEGAKTYRTDIEISLSYYGSNIAPTIVYREGSFGKVSATYKTSYKYSTDVEKLEFEEEFTSTNLLEEELTEKLQFFLSLLQEAIWKRLTALQAHPFELNYSDFFDIRSDALVESPHIPVIGRMEDLLSTLLEENTLGPWEVIRSIFPKQAARNGLEVLKDGELANSLTYTPSFSFLFRNREERLNFLVHFKGIECSVVASGVTLLKSKKTSNGHLLLPGYNLTSAGRVALLITRLFD